MFNIVKSSMEWNGKTLSVEVGRVARQASSVWVSYGKTCVLVSVTAGKEVGSDFSSGLALVVNFLSKSYATGKIPGGFFKREGRPPEREVLASRMIDRSIRPLIDENLLNEINITCNLLSYESSCSPEVVSLVGASIALMNINAPFSGPVAGAGLGYDGENYIFNSSPGCENSLLDLFVASTGSSVVMIEAESKELKESLMYDAVVAAHNNIQPVVAFIEEFVEKCKTQNLVDEDSEDSEDSDDSGSDDSAYGGGYSGREQFCEWKFNENKALESELKDFCKSDLEALYAKQYSKAKRHTKLYEIYSAALQKFSPNYEKAEIKSCMKKIEGQIVRKRIIDENVRIDGRSSTDVREIDIEVGALEQVHGSALFTRGGTQALVVLTLGSFQDEQVVDDFDGDRRENFMLHYNFLPYSVGEVGPVRAPGRREIGHGRLAFKAIKAVLPSRDAFAYTTRVVSEITESDGSSSMATVCGTSLALMDTGVPIKKAVAGIAMGLVKDGDDYVILSDILGDEDSLGDMDFKIAGTKDGITAMQLDIKMNGIEHAFVEKILEQALEGRLHILSKMNQIISVPNSKLKDSAPKIISFKVPKESVQRIIGTAGKNIKAISEQYVVKVDIDSNCNVYISGESTAMLMSAKAAVEAFVESSSNSGGSVSGSSSSGNFVPEEGKVYSGVVVSIMTYGVFVEIAPSIQGLVHISEIVNARLENVRDVLTEADKVMVVLKSIDSSGRLKLSMKYVDQNTGELSSDYSSASTESPRREGARRPSFGSRDGARSNNSRPSFGGNRDPRSSNTGGRRDSGSRSSSDSGRSSRDPNKRFF